VQRAFIDACKRVQKRELTRLLAELAASLEVDPNMPVPSGLMMSWDELRSAAKRGIAVGAHTVTHPMLTRVSCEEAYEEMARSKAIIESKLGLPVESFAYPSGSFTTAHESMARNADFCIAFAADGGATFASEVRARPYAVRRVCICMRDDLPRFAFKAAGLTRYSKLERAT
jgi:peptidoglycan/xylan/chitin deacetylase (PgdA/CDA1 family)